MELIEAIGLVSGRDLDGLQAGRRSQSSEAAEVLDTHENTPLAVGSHALSTKSRRYNSPTPFSDDITPYASSRHPTPKAKHRPQQGTKSPDSTPTPPPRHTSSRHNAHHSSQRLHLRPLPPSLQDNLPRPSQQRSHTKGETSGIIHVESERARRSEEDARARKNRLRHMAETDENEDIEERL
ncbi:hypothetical protein BGZ73_001577, partial [Actinomortierella ambigua]